MNQGGENAFPRWIKFALAGTMLAFIAGGIWFFKAQQGHQRKEVEARLWSIARLKSGQISEWRAERLADAAILMERQGLVESVRRFLSLPTDEEASEISRRFRTIKEHYRFRDVLLVDLAKRVRLSLDPKMMDLHRGYASTLDSAMAEHSPLWTPFHVDPDYPSPH
ncbi:MAG: hypothetical protein HY788_15255, partial [Deltaproteobacteria bacterium]|nr:hypothetical protein [Deltaproteobacteria bacterium]